MLHEPPRGRGRNYTWGLSPARLARLSQTDRHGRRPAPLRSVCLFTRQKRRIRAACDYEVVSRELAALRRRLWRGLLSGPRGAIDW